MVHMQGWIMGAFMFLRRNPLLKVHNYLVRPPCPVLLQTKSVQIADQSKTNSDFAAKMSSMQEGDLIFSCTLEEGNAIASVEAGYHGARFDHMGVIVQTTEDDSFQVLEAYRDAVKITSLEEFRKTSGDRLGFARLAEQYAHLIPAAIEYGRKQVGKPYDNFYLTDEGKLYCSELVVDMFKYANKGEEFFKETPMSFRDDSTGEINPEWIAFYKYHGIPVPEGQPGSHPSDISLDERIKFYDVDPNVYGYVP